MSDIIALNPIAASTPTLSNLSCGTQSLTGAQTKGCTVALNAAATSQMVVALSSSSSSLVVPSSVTVARGSTSAAFTATASAIKSSLKVTLTASANGVSQTDVITLYPAQATVPALSKLACGTQTLVPPSTEACAVYLSSAAVSATVVTLSSSKTVLQVPSSVTIAAGSTSASFSAKALAVTTTQSVTLTATSSGVSLTDVLQLQGTTTSQPPSTPSQVQLSWDAPPATSDPIAGYHVYRSTGGGSNYTQLSSLDTSTTYTDSTVQSGTTYDYVVKSVDTKGMESAPSNPISVTIP
jgi:hypothetical protein